MLNLKNTLLCSLLLAWSSVSLSIVEESSDQTLIVFFEAEINDGEVEAARELVQRMVSFNEPDEPETLAYKVFISEDKKLLTFMETYANSDAMLFHDDRFAKNFADDISKLTLGARLCIYGNISEKYKNFAEESGFEVEYFGLIDGFNR